MRNAIAFIDIFETVRVSIIFILLAILADLLYSNCSPANQPKSNIAPNGDTLRKYSYLIWWRDKLASKTHQGTGSFLRKGDSLYFLTARHNMRTFNNTEHQLFQIWLTDSNGLLNRKAIAVSFYLKEKLHFYNPFFPDVIMFPVKASFPVYSIENMISYDSPKPDEYMCIYGYPRSNNKDTVGGWTFNNSKKSLSKVIKVNEGFPFYLNKELPVDTFNYSITSSVNAFDSIGGGYSGSPVWVYNKSKKRWLLRGVLSMVEQDSPYLFVIKPKVFWK